MNLLRSFHSALFLRGALFLFFIAASVRGGVPTQLGDLDGDGQVTVLDLVALINHTRSSPALSPSVSVFADVNLDGVVNQTDVTLLAQVILGQYTVPSLAARAVTIEPPSGTSDVGVMVRPKVTFSKPVKTASLSSNNFYASFAGQKLPATITPANDGTFAWLFLSNALPNAAQITVTVDGSTITNQDGSVLDAAGVGKPGSSVSVNFGTVSVTPVPGTVLAGRLVDPGPDLVPRTSDDLAFGVGGMIYKLPIAGAKVYVLGMETNVAFTDTNGSFFLTNMPVGNVKVVLEGRTATNPPAGFYFPEMVMDTTFLPGVTNGVMTVRDTNGVVVRGTNGAPIPLAAMYLPRVATNVLKTVSASSNTVVTLQANAAYDLPSNQVQYLTIQIASNSLVGANGQMVSNAQIGVSVVPAELVKDMLPAGLLQHTFDITVQAPGLSTFSTPATMTFPNVFNAAPGTKLNFLSFDHTTGRLVIDGTCTVSSNGLYVTTDPGNGVTHPGWHGMTPPGSPPNPYVPHFMVCYDGSQGIIPDAQSAAECEGNFFQRNGFGGSLWTKVKRALGGGKFEISTERMASGVRGSSLVAPDLRLDFGTASSPLAPGYVRVTPNTIYSSNSGLGTFGWAALTNEVVEAFDRGGADDLTRDVNVTRLGEFSINVSNGLFGLTMTLGDSAAACSNVAVYVQRMFGNSVSTKAGQFVTNLFVFPVTNSRIDVLIGAITTDQDKGAITHMEIKRIEDDDLPRTAGAAALDGRLFYYAYINLENGFVTRGTSTSPEAMARQLFFPPNTRFLQMIADPVGPRVASAAFTTPDSGIPVQLPEIDLEYPYHESYGAAVILDPFEPPFGGDTDGDGLSDDIEFVIGSNPLAWSTAGDGISDGAKLAQGLDVLSGASFPQGVIASLPLSGEAREVVLAGTTNGVGQLAYVANGSGGLAIVNASQFQKPVVVSRLALPGTASDVAVDATLPIVVVAANEGGLHFVNVADPVRPQLIRSVSGFNITQVEIIRGVVYATSGTQIWSYDLTAGTPLQSLDLGGSAITSLAAEGLFLYTLSAGSVLRAIDVTDPLLMQARGSLTLPSVGGRVFVGSGIAYIGADTGFAGGFVTANVANPNALALISGVDLNSVAGRKIVANGSGLAVAVGNPGGAGGGAVLDVMDVSDPGNTGAFLVRYRLPAPPLSVALGSGIAYVADGSAGLQVINYRSFDGLGIPPSVSLSNTFTMTDATNGFAESGKAVRTAAKITDDVQVRDVEFYLDGVRQFTDVSFPFEYNFVIPTRSVAKTNFTLQAKATDSGGNTNWSAMLNITITPDMTAPRVTQTFPSAYGFAGASANISAYFSEPIDAGTLSAADFQVTFLGADGVPGTSDDLLVTNGVISYRADLNAAVLTFGTNLPAGAYLATVSPPVADLAGNPLPAAYSWQFYVIGGQDSDSDGLPDIVEVALGLDPHKASTYNDGILDGNRDLNGDGLKAAWKIRYGYDPLKRDSLNDGTFDKDRDPDNDALTNLQEQQYGTNPFKADTDGDGWSDEAEIVAGSNPLDPTSRPAMVVVATPPVKMVLPQTDAVLTNFQSGWVATPPVQLVLPTSAGTSGVTGSVWVASPPITISLPISVTNAASLVGAVFVGQPPVQLVLPALDNGTNATPGLFVAQPPVQISLPSAIAGTNAGSVTVAQPPVRIQFLPP